MTDMIADPELEKLKAGLEGVTPGPWFNHGREGQTQPIIVGCYEVGPRRRLFAVYQPHGSTAEAKRNAAHIARCDPATIAALIARLEAAEGLLDQLAHHVDDTAARQSPSALNASSAARDHLKAVRGE